VHSFSSFAHLFSSLQAIVDVQRQIYQLQAQVSRNEQHVFALMKNITSPKRS
jgi:hypothetical protein